jgi:hypothetical protein
MSEYYRQPITVFGLMLPVVVMLILVTAVLTYTSSVKSQYTVKKKKFDTSQTAKRKLAALRNEVGEHRPKMVVWDEMLRKETRGTFLEHWKRSAEDFTGKELTKSSRSWINYSEGLGKGVSQPSSQVVMSFIGTYRAMQLALMRLETTLPTMQLDSLDISENGNGQGVKFTTKYTVWTRK